MDTKQQQRPPISETAGKSHLGGNNHATLHPGEDAWAYFQSYARQRPDVVALWCFGVGFVLGWKLKPW